MGADSVKVQPKAANYAMVLAFQVIAAIVFVWSELPAFRQLAINPGRQIAETALDDIETAVVLLAMQSAYWYRQIRIPTPSFASNTLLNHVLLFISRLSFIFGAAVFSLVVFRHLPELRSDVDLFVTGRRGLLVTVSLFALFCVSLELERLGNAFSSKLIS
jgi:hypothetical protein